MLLDEMNLRMVGTLEEARSGNVAGPKEMAGTAVDDDDFVPFSLRTQLEAWERVFEATVSHNRSLAIGCQLLLQHTRDVCATEPQPNLIMLVSSLMILAHFMPLFGPYRDLMQGIIAEISQAVYIRSNSGTGSSKNADTYTKRTHFASFFDVLRNFTMHRSRGKSLHTRYNLQRRVLHKSSHWENLVLRATLCSWKGSIRIMKSACARHIRIVQEATQRTVVQEVLARWKRLGTRRALASLRQQSTQVLDQLAVAQSGYKAARVALHHIEQQISKESETLSKNEEELIILRNRRAATDVRLAASQDVYTSHVAAWHKTMNLLFGDSRPLTVDRTAPEWMSEDSKKRRLQNLGDLTIVDTAATFRRRANRRQTTVPVSALVGFVSDLFPEIVRLVTVPGTADEEKVVAVSRYLFNGVVMPIAITDLARGEFSKVLGFTQLVKYMFGGGHCGAFLHDLLQSVPFHSKLDPKSMTSGEGLAMMGDIDGGIEALSHAREARLIIDDMYRTEVTIGQTLDWYRAATRAFASLSSFDDQELKYVIESTLCSTVFAARGDLQLMLGLTYPRQGISSALELLQFAATTAEMTGLQGGDILQCLESNIVLTPIQVVVVEAASRDVKGVVKMFRLHILGMMRSCSDDVGGRSTMSCSKSSKDWSPNSKRVLSEESCAAFFLSNSSVAALITEHEVTAYARAVKEACDEDALVNLGTFVVLLILIAMHCDPSPFESTSWKLKSLLLMLTERHS